MHGTSNAFPTEGKWSREQVMLVFHFYFQTPFGRQHSRNPKIIELANLIGRTPGAVAMKLNNLASLDPSITESGRKGLEKKSALDRRIWAEFHGDWERLATECAELRKQLRQIQDSTAQQQPESEDNFILEDYSGETREAIVQQRIKQTFFRHAVLASYRSRCCISGVSDTRLLVASHIVPWRQDKANRLNPSNGLCLSAIHDKAFDKHLFSLTDDHHIVLSAELKASKDSFVQEVFWPLEDRQISLPDRFHPEPTFLRSHRKEMLEAQAGAAPHQPLITTINNEMEK